MDKIEFRGKSNMDFINLFVHDPGVKKKPREKIIQYDEIPGRSGSLIEHTGVYEAYERIITLYDKDGRYEYFEWLQGSGNLRLSTEPKGFYKASVFEEFDINTIKGLKVKYLEVPFLVQPFFYLDKGQHEIKMSSTSMTLLNEYKIVAKPLIKLVGNGELSFGFNGKIIEIYDVVNHVYIDSELLTCYSTQDYKSKKMVGEFPVLESGENLLTKISGDIYITPRWCTL